MKRRAILSAAVAALASAALPAAPVLTLHGDGEHDDTAALQALIEGRPVVFRGKVIAGPAIPPGLYCTGHALRIYQQPRAPWWYEDGA